MLESERQAVYRERKKEKEEMSNLGPHVELWEILLQPNYYQYA